MYYQIIETGVVVFMCEPSWENPVINLHVENGQIQTWFRRDLRRELREVLLSTMGTDSLWFSKTEQAERASPILTSIYSICITK